MPIFLYKRGILRFELLEILLFKIFNACEEHCISFNCEMALREVVYHSHRKVILAVTKLFQSLYIFNVSIQAKVIDVNATVSKSTIILNQHSYL